MNTPASSSTPRSTTSEPRERDEAASPRERDDFERALRARLATPGDREDPSGEQAPMGENMPATPWTPLPVPHACRAETAVPAAAARVVAEGPAEATRQAIGTALNAGSPALSMPCGRPESASSWQVSINDPRGVPVELRAARVAQGQPTAGQPAWALTLAGPLRETSLLVRHAPRLDERLRARALSDTPVRVEQDDEEATP